MPTKNYANQGMYILFIIFFLIIIKFARSESFIDDTKSNFDDFSCVNMIVEGIGGSANLTSSGRNVSGSCGSPVHNANQTVNMTSIGCQVEYPYGTELGRANNDTNDAALENIFINTSGLVALWHFNNESELGESTEGVTETALDFSVDINSERTGGVRNNGTFVNGGTISKTDYRIGGGAVELDGSNEYLDMGDDSSLDLTGDLSIVLWFFARTFPSGNPTLISKRDAFASIDWELFYHNSGGDPKLDIEFWYGNTGSFKLFDALDVNPSTNEWHHIVVTRNVDDWRLYLDGVSQGTETDSNTMPTGDNVLIGTLGLDATADAFDGFIDEVSMWSRSLSTAEIKNLYMRGAIRLNISARGCDDASCDGETFEQTNTSVFGGSFPLNFSSEFQYVQWNATYSNNASTTISDRPVINNCTIEFEITTDTISPAFSSRQPANATTSIDSDQIFNITITEVGGSSVNITQLWTNSSGGLWLLNQSDNWTDAVKHIFNVTDFDVSEIVWAVFANDSLGNFNYTQNFTFRPNQAAAPEAEEAEIIPDIFFDILVNTPNFGNKIIQGVT